MTLAANDLSGTVWAPESSGELDHRLVKAPYIRLVSSLRGMCGDFVYVFDLRITQPNVGYLTTLQVHSLEHLFLAAFRKYLSDTFVSVSPMGCQTGFYLVLLNEARAGIIQEVYEKVLLEIFAMKEVPYANERDCGQAIHHSLQDAKEVARMLLEAKEKWLSVFGEPP